MNYRMCVAMCGGALCGALLTGIMVSGEIVATCQVRAAVPEQTYTRLTVPRVSPIDPADYTDEQRVAVGSGPTNENMRTALYEPELGRRWWSWLPFVWNSSARGNAAIPPREKELVILRVNWLCHDDWVWGRHVPIAKREGRTDEEIARIPSGPDMPGWSDDDAALLRAADELHENAFISDSTWSKLAARYNESQMLDLIFTVGNYHTNAFFTNSVGMPLGGIEGLPQPD